VSYLPDPATALRCAVERCVQRKRFPGAVYLVARGDAVLSWEAVIEWKKKRRLIEFHQAED
jgi:hypothetical protein